MTTGVGDANNGGAVHINIGPGVTVSLANATVPTFTGAPGSLSLGDGTPNGFAGNLSGGSLNFNGPLAVYESGGEDVSAKVVQAAVMSASPVAANAPTISTVLGGTGALEIFASDAARSDGLVLTATNTYSGGTVFETDASSGNNLQLGDGVHVGTLGSGAVSTATGVSGTLIFDEPTATVFANTISGNVSLIQEGAGTVTLNGINTNTGSTEIQSGELIVGDESHASAKLGGSVQIDAGGTLSGLGTIAGSVTNDGTLNNNDPFLPAGLTITGNYVQGAGANLIIGVTPTTTTLLTVGGTASLAGTVTFAYAPGTYHATSLTFLKSGGLGGTKFDTVADSTAIPDGFSQSVSYSTTDASVVLTGSSPVIVGPRDGEIYAAQTLSFAEANADAVTALLGRTLADGGGNTFVNVSQPGGPQARVWLTGTGSLLNGGHNNGALGGLDGGADVQLGAGGRLGLSVGYEGGSLSDGAGGHANENLVRVSGYGSQVAGLLVFSEVISYAHNTGDVSRASGFGYSSTGRTVDEVSGALQVSAPLDWRPVTVTPAVGVLVADVMSRGFIEHNAGSSAFAMGSPDRSYTAASPYAQIGLSRTFETSGGWRVTPDLMAGYRYDQAAQAARLALVAQDGTVFSNIGAGHDPNTGLVGASLTANRAGFTGFVRYRATLSSGWTDQSISGGLRLAF